MTTSAFFREDLNRAWNHSFLPRTNRAWGLKTNFLPRALSSVVSKAVKGILKRPCSQMVSSLGIFRMWGRVPDKKDKVISAFLSRPASLCQFMQAQYSMPETLSSGSIAVCKTTLLVSWFDWRATSTVCWWIPPSPPNSIRWSAGSFFGFRI